MWTKRRNLFGITRHGIPLNEYMLSQKVRVGIEIHNELYGTVPEYEALEAATYCGYTLVQWLELDYTERASLVAQYRIHLSIEAHVQDAVTRAANRKRGRR